MRSSLSDSEGVCKCHGVSGSCAVRTCFKELTDMPVIAAKLRVKYNEACEVKSNGHSQNGWVPKTGKCSGFTEEDFIFRTDYDWCQENQFIGATGVVGRVCEPHSDGPNSCQNLCRRCDKRPVQLKKLVQIQKNCHFDFCCHITCERLQLETTYHMCA